MIFIYVLLTYLHRKRADFDGMENENRIYGTGFASFVNRSKIPMFQLHIYLFIEETRCFARKTFHAPLITQQ